MRRVKKIRKKRRNRVLLSAVFLLSILIVKKGYAPLKQVDVTAIMKKWLVREISEAACRQYITFYMYALRNEKGEKIYAEKQQTTILTLENILEDETSAGEDENLAQLMREENETAGVLNQQENSKFVPHVRQQWFDLEVLND